MRKFLFPARAPAKVPGTERIVTRTVATLTPTRPKRRGIDWRPVACACIAAGLFYFGDRSWIPASIQQAFGVSDAVPAVDFRDASAATVTLEAKPISIAPITAKPTDTRQAQIDDQQATIRSLENRLAGSEQELTQLRPQVDGLKRQIKELSDALQRQAASLTAARAETAAAQQEAASARAAPPPAAPVANPAKPDVAPAPVRATVATVGVSTSTTVERAVSPSGTPNCERAVDAVDGGPMTLFFDRYKDTLEPAHHETLNQVLTIALACPDAKLEIKGHSDNRGAQKLKSDISQRRADLASQYFALHGIKAEQMSVVAMSDRAPIDDNGTDAGRARNRRVDVRVRFDK